MQKGIKIAIFALIGLGIFGFVELGYYKAKAEVAQLLLERAWTQTQHVNLSAQTNIKPWPWADTWPVFKLTVAPSSENVTKQSKLTPTSHIVLADTSGESLAFAPGVLTPYIQPGMEGNSIIAAHRDTHFAYLQHAQIDDEMSVEMQQGERVRFKIDDIRVVNSEEEQPILDSDEARLTLVTCYPFDQDVSQTPLRLLVSGVKIVSF